MSTDKPLPSREREGQLGKAERGGNDRRPTMRAQALRNSATLSERRLWNALKGRQVCGAKFGRQMPVGPYICDFLCRDRQLVVEVDGPSHDLTVMRDDRRTRFLEDRDYRVLRFANDDIRFRLDFVIAAIETALTPTPALRATPPAGGRGESSAPLPSREREGQLGKAERGGVT